MNEMIPPQPPVPAPPPMHVAGPATSPPAVWGWFIAYCVVMAFIYLLVAGMGLVFMLVDPRDLDMEPVEAMIVGGVYLGLGLILMLPFAAAPWLPKRKWVWVFDLVLICLGMTSCCTLPACIPMLIYWLRPETKVMFGWT